jgi:acetolactate synthase-1/2/3 large subunit
LTKWNTTIDLAEQIPSAVRTAFRAMTTGKPGSAHICLPHDVQKHSVNAGDIWAQKEHAHYPSQRYVANDTAIDSAATEILSAQFPVFICGGGIVNAGAEQVLQNIAELLNIPVCTTVSGQGSLADTHPLNVGVVGANGGVMATREVVNSADLVFFISCRAGSTTTENWRFPNKTIPIIHLDVDPETIGANYPIKVSLVGAAKLTLEELYSRLKTNIQTRSKGCVDGKAVVAKAKELKF